MLPPARKRDVPKRLDPHPPGSKHELISTRVKKNAEKKKQRDIKRKQREDKNVEKKEEEMLEKDIPDDLDMEKEKKNEGKEA